MNVEPMCDIETRVLRSFISVAAEQSISGAAKRHSRSPGTMSMRIANLESRIGLRLFERGRYNLKLTAAGRDLLPGVQAFVDMHDRVFDRARVKLASGTVRLGVGEGCGFDLILWLLRQVQEHYADVRLSIHCGLGQEVTAGIQAGEFELAVVALPEKVPSATVLSRPRIHWVARPDFVLEKLPVIPVACFPEGSFFRAAGIQTLEAEGIAYYELLNSPGEEAVQHAVRAGAAIAIMVEGTVPRDLRVIMRPSVLPRLGKACIQLLESSSPATDAVLAVKGEILNLYASR